MARTLFLVCLVSLFVGSCRRNKSAGLPQQDPVDPEAIDAAVKSFATELKQALLTAMADGGPREAIKVCSEKAPELANAHSGQTGWKIRRTSHRLRNPLNAPDAWEQEQIDFFRKQLTAGLKASDLVTHETVNGELRYARAIPTAAECLICHGSTNSPEVETALEALYPDDKATGFELGDLRGIFSVRIPAGQNDQD